MSRTLVVRECIPPAISGRTRLTRLARIGQGEGNTGCVWGTWRVWLAKACSPCPAWLALWVHARGHVHALAASVCLVTDKQDRNIGQRRRDRPREGRPAAGARGWRAAHMDTYTTHEQTHLPVSWPGERATREHAPLGVCGRLGDAHWANSVVKVARGCWWVMTGDGELSCTPEPLLGQLILLLRAPRVDSGTLEH